MSGRLAEVEALIMDPAVGVVDASTQGAITNAPDVGGELAKASETLGGRAGGVAGGLAKGRGVAAAYARLEGKGGRVGGVICKLLQQEAEVAPEGAALRDHAAGVACGVNDGGAAVNIISAGVEEESRACGNDNEEQKGGSALHVV
ncbi:hypothetical protein L7F22_029348 [Adiantum nelumboides]|nr:hypothetical protein [Adiantum nelumboides]